MVHMTPGLWAMVALCLLAWALVLWAVFRPAKPRTPKYHVVSWRVLWWRKAAPPREVRRQLIPIEVREPELARTMRRINDLFTEDAAEEGDHAHA